MIRKKKQINRHILVKSEDMFTGDQPNFDRVVAVLSAAHQQNTGEFPFDCPMCQCKMTVEWALSENAVRCLDCNTEVRLIVYRNYLIISPLVEPLPVYVLTL